MPKYNCSMGDSVIMLAEECSEVIQAAMKHTRFVGTSAYVNPRTGKTAWEELTQEIGDVLVCIDILISQGRISAHAIADAKAEKVRRLIKNFPDGEWQ